MGRILFSSWTAVCMKLWIKEYSVAARGYLRGNRRGFQVFSLESEGAAWTAVESWKTGNDIQLGNEMHISCDLSAGVEREGECA